MEFKLEWPWDKTPAHQVFIPVHKNNYFKVMKKHSLLGKQMEPHVSETIWEKTANFMSRQQLHVKEDPQRLCSHILPTDKDPGKAGPLEIIPPIRKPHAPSICQAHCFRGIWEDSPFFLHPPTAQFISLMLPYQLYPLWHSLPYASFFSVVPKDKHIGFYGWKTLLLN